MVRHFRDSVMQPALVATIALVVARVPLTAQATRGENPGATLELSSVEDSTLFGPLRWRNIGPNKGGRSIAVAGSRSRPQEYYFGATGGGLWKSINGGAAWFPVGDGQFRTSSVGAIGVCEANPDVVYVGMGEVELRGDIIQGDGVYRSTDGGQSWTHLGLESSTGQQAVGRVRVHPDNCDLVYAAVLGDPFGPSEERGVYRSSDGGRTWKRVLYRDQHTGAVDLDMDPNDPRTLYATLWEGYRTPWTIKSGGPGSGIFKSVDGGDTWAEITRNPGLPKGLLGKMGISVSGADSRRVYAIIEAEHPERGALYRSDDAGTTWEEINDHRALRHRSYYYMRVYADPVDRDVVYVVNIAFYRSADGGRTFRMLSTPHGDNHDLWIAPNDDHRLIESNDGGANVSYDGGATWTDQTYPTAQLYFVTTTQDYPYHVCGAQQDNSTACVPSDGDGSWWYSVGGCESGNIAAHPEDPDIFYAGCRSGRFTYFDRRTGQGRQIDPAPFQQTGSSAAEVAERFQWTSPLVLSPRDPEVLYVASQHLWKTVNRGQSWVQISPDLTRADPETLGPAGGPITYDQTGVEVYGTIFAVTPSPHDPQTIWVGSDDGLVHVTRDGGQSWKDVTPPVLPHFSRVNMIEVSPRQPSRAYLAVIRYRLQDVKTYLLRTDDYGETWSDVGGGIPDGEFVRVVREDPVQPGLLYAGTERGPYVSFDDGETWRSLRLDLLAVSVFDLIVRNEDLVIATHGRSFYVMDDISPLREVTAKVLEKTVHLVAPAPVVRTLATVTGGEYRQVRRAGLRVYYYLAQPAREVKLEFLDAQGHLVRDFIATSAEAEQVVGRDKAGWPIGTPEARPSRRRGLNLFVWDLHHGDASGFPGLQDVYIRGPLVPPGSYTVRITADGQTESHTFEIKADPRLTSVSERDLEDQYQLGLRIWERVSEANDAVVLARRIKDEIQGRLRLTEDRAVHVAGDQLIADISDVEHALYQGESKSHEDILHYGVELNGQIGYLLSRLVESADARPTDQTYAAFQALSAQLDQKLARLQALSVGDLEQLNALLRSQNLGPILIRPSHGG